MTLTDQVEHHNHPSGSLQHATTDLADYLHNMGQCGDWSSDTDWRIHHEVVHTEEVS